MRPYFLSRRFYSFRHFVCAIVIILFLGQPAFGGKLQDFEQDVTEEREEEKPRIRYEDEDEAEEGFWTDLFGSIFRGVFEGMFDDDDNDDDKDHIQVEKSYVEESKIEVKDFLHNRALLPTFRFDGNYQDVESDVRAFDLRSELGSGYYAIQGRLTGYTEDDPSDELGYMQIHGLFRLPIDDLVEMDFGAGAVFLNGDDRNSGFSLTLPILIYPKESVGIEFRPCWSWINENPLSDYDLGIVLSRSHVALRLGYRWVRSEHESLDGPYAGLSFRF